MPYEARQDQAPFQGVQLLPVRNSCMHIRTLLLVQGDNQKYQNLFTRNL